LSDADIQQAELKQDVGNQVETATWVERRSETEGERSECERASERQSVMGG
jgi:hypothetical protein